MKAGGSKHKVFKKLTKKIYSILDWDNRKANPKLVRRLLSATYQELDYEQDIQTNI